MCIRDRSYADTENVNDKLKNNKAPAQVVISVEVLYVFGGQHLYRVTYRMLCWIWKQEKMLKTEKKG